MNSKSRLAIAALIHDIGKLGYRAREKGKHPLFFLLTNDNPFSSSSYRKISLAITLKW